MFSIHEYFFFFLMSTFRVVFTSNDPLFSVSWYNHLHWMEIQLSLSIGVNQCHCYFNALVPKLTRSGTQEEGFALRHNESVPYFVLTIFGFFRFASIHF